MGRYMVVMRQPGQRNWRVSDRGLQLLSTAIKEAKISAKLSPKSRVQVWMEITTIKRMKVIR